MFKKKINELEDWPKVIIENNNVTKMITNWPDKYNKYFISTKPEESLGVFVNADKLLEIPDNSNAA